MTLPEVEMLSNYWAEFPPLHLLVRGFVGFKGSEQSKASAPSMGELQAMANTVNAGSR